MELIFRHYYQHNANCCICSLSFLRSVRKLDKLFTKVKAINFSNGDELQPSCGSYYTLHRECSSQLLNIQWKIQIWRGEYLQFRSSIKGTSTILLLPFICDPEFSTRYQPSSAQKLQETYESQHLKYV